MTVPIVMPSSAAESPPYHEAIITAGRKKMNRVWTSSHEFTASWSSAIRPTLTTAAPYCMNAGRRANGISGVRAGIVSFRVMEVSSVCSRSFTRELVMAAAPSGAATTMKTAATVKTAATEARSPAEGVAARDASMIESAERVGTRTGLEVRRCVRAGNRESWIHSGTAAMKSRGVIEMRTSVIEMVAIDESSAVGDVGVMVVSHVVPAPVESPVAPAPPEASEQADPEAGAERDSRSADVESGIRSPTRVGGYRVAVDGPGV